MTRPLTPGEKTLITDYYSALGITIDVDSVVVRNDEKLFDGSFGTWEQPDDTMMVASDGEIFIPSDHPYNYTDFSTQGDWDAKGTLIHELWHVEQSENMTRLGYALNVGSDAMEGNYNYEVFFSPGTEWSDLTSEQQAEFMKDYFLKLNGQDIEYNKGKGGTVGEHTLTEYGLVWGQVITYTEVTPIITDHQYNPYFMPSDTNDDREDTDTYHDTVADHFVDAENEGSPLVLDIDGNGYELISLNSDDAVYWDIDADGFSEASGWITGGDALLAMDSNSDGRITNNNELFGNTSGQPNGFLALAQYDSNSDGTINNQDAIWDDLIVWIDNGDSVSEDSEMYSMDALLISQVDLAYTNVNTTVSGNSILQESTYIINGNARNIADVWFKYSNSNTVYNDGYISDYRAVDMPTMRGYGSMANLHISISLDNNGANPSSLISLVDAFDSKTFEQLFNDSTDVIDDVRAIMFRWAGVDGLSPTSRGDNIDARELAFLEKFMGEPFLQRETYEDPYYFSAENLKEAFSVALNNIYARLVIQSDNGNIFSGDWYYNVPTDSVIGFTGLGTSALSNLSAQAALSSDLESFWSNVVRVIEFTVGVSNLSVGDQDDLDDAIYASNPSLNLNDVLDSLGWEAATGVNLSGNSSANTLNGGVGNDVITAGAGNDTLNGGIGQDKLYGQANNDILNGNTGADYLWGGFGSDTYNYIYGDGEDTIQEEGSGTGNITDKIVFGAGITLSNLSFSRVGNSDLIIDISGTTTGKIIIENQFNGSGSVETLQFNGGTTYSLVSQAWSMYGTNGNDVLYGVTSGGLLTDTIYGQGGNDTIYSDTGNDIVYGGDGDDYIQGGAGNDNIYGDDGNDILYGEANNDTLRGGHGDDFMYGGDGNDIYHYISGIDTIVESTGTTDKIILNSAWNGVTPQYLRIGYDLRLLFDENDYITIKDHFGYYVETLQYANGTTVNLTTVSYVAQGTSGNDSLSGNSSANTMYGEAGNDSLYGYDGDDTMYGGTGDDYLSGDNQNDSLYGEAGNDTLYGGSGNNYFDGGAGDDYLEGSSGNDTYFYSSGYDRIYDYGGADVLKIVSGYDSDDLSAVRRKTGTSDFYDLRIEFSSTNYVMIDDYFNSSSQAVETLMLADLTTITLSSLTYTSYGSSSADSIWGVYSGGSTNDIMYGLDGDDTLDGDAGNDILYGGNGNDTLYGDGGDDIYVFEAGLDIFSEYGPSVDTIRIEGAFTVDNLTFSSVGSYDTKITLNSGTNEITVKDLRYSGSAYHIEFIEFSDGFRTTLPDYATWTNGGSGNNTITGTSVANTILGKGGNDTLNGAGGNDAVHGGAGTDIVKGGAGADLVHGGTGNDTIFGQDGLDTLFGGSGSDEFVFESASAYNNIDVIKDFKLSENDKLDIANLLTSYNPLTHAIEDFVQMTDSGSNTLLKVDRDGTASTYSWQQIATIEGVTGLTNEAALKASGNLITA